MPHRQRKDFFLRSPPDAQSKGVEVMAKKRCFSSNVVESDAFLDLPYKAQTLYFHLCMYGDDDGFVANPMSVARSIKLKSDKELSLLTDAGFIIRFSSGVIVVSDWWENNNLQNDRYSPTVYQDEFANLLPIDHAKKSGLKRYRLKTGTE